MCALWWYSLSVYMLVLDFPHLSLTLFPKLHTEVGVEMRWILLFIFVWQYLLVCVKYACKIFWIWYDHHHTEEENRDSFHFSTCGNGFSTLSWWDAKLVQIYAIQVDFFCSIIASSAKERREKWLLKEGTNSAVVIVVIILILLCSSFSSSSLRCRDQTKSGKEIFCYCSGCARSNSIYFSIHYPILISTLHVSLTIYQTGESVILLFISGIEICCFGFRTKRQFWEI